MANLRLTLACGPYNRTQGLSERLLRIEELFAPSTLRDIPLTEGQRV